VCIFDKIQRESELYYPKKPFLDTSNIQGLHYFVSFFVFYLTLLLGT
jgi:hypothetical protein